MNQEKKKQCNFKCSMCEHYERTHDFCKEKEIKGCSKVKTDFSTCESYLVKQSLIMF